MSARIRRARPIIVRLEKFSRRQIRSSSSSGRAMTDNGALRATASRPPTRRPSSRGHGIMSMNSVWLEAPVGVLALLFFVSATTKVTETAGIEGYMQAYGVPGILMWPAAAWEYIVGALLLVGLYLRQGSVLLAGWCVLTAVIFHTKFSDLDQLMNFFKNM